MNRAVYDVHELPPLGKWIPLSLQHLFAMFGATILVPILTGLNPAVALFTAGAGTLLFHFITGRQVPAYLGSSFAFIAPLIAVQGEFGDAWLGPALGGVISVGLLYAVFALFIRLLGTGWLDRVLPPVVIGSVIVVIGLGLAPVGVEMAGLSTAGSSDQVLTAVFTLVVTIVSAVALRGFFSVIPVLVGVVAGYLFALWMGLVDLTGVQAAAWFGLPWAGGGYAVPEFRWAALSLIFPVGFVTIAEHLGDVYVISKVVGREYYKEPGLHRTLLGDGLATSLAGLFGGPPNTTYGENVGVLAITRVYSTAVVSLAGLFAILLSFIPKLGALLQTIPTPVMGGITIVLFGIIASSGIRTLVESGIDYGAKRNLIISSVILVLGIGGAEVRFGDFVLQGMALATLAGIILNLVIPREAAPGAAEGAARGE